MLLHYENLRLYLELVMELVKITEFLKLVNRHVSNRILTLMQQNGKKLRHPFCKLVQTVYKQRVWQNNGVSSK